jgi:hypothetical protein
MNNAYSPVTVRIPMALKRYGCAKRIVAPDGSDIVPRQHREPDPTLVKALARAFRWRKLLENGTFGTITELAKAEKINSSYVSRILRLTLLAPDLVQAILSASLDRAVTIDLLMKPFPSNWREQEELVANASSASQIDCY